MYAVGILLIAVVLAFVGWPLFRAGKQPALLPLAAEESDLEAWERQKLDAYGAIREAEFDYNTGKLSDGDLERLREKYTARALEAIAALEKGKKRTPISGARRPARVAFCPGCGTKLPARANFCPACGQSLQEITSAA